MCDYQDGQTKQASVSLHSSLSERLTLIERQAAEIERLKAELANARKTIESQQMSLTEWIDVVAQIGRQVGCLSSHFSDGNDFVVAKVGKQQAHIAQLEKDLEQYTHQWRLRGQALERPCLQCGYEPKRITLADGSTVLLKGDTPDPK